MYTKCNQIYIYTIYSVNLNNGTITTRTQVKLNGSAAAAHVNIYRLIVATF